MPTAEPHDIRAVLFDFDGTLSLLREGWPTIMTDMMVERLRTGDDTPASLEALAVRVEELIMRLNGKPAIHQMIAFNGLMAERGLPTDHPEALLDEYHRRLLTVVEGRIATIADGSATPADWAVPGTHALLQSLRDAGVSLWLASGSLLEHVRREAELLDVARFFPDRLFAPSDATPDFSKRGVIERLLAEEGIDGERLAGIGDGTVETQEVGRTGGFAIGVASQPRGVAGEHPDKRRRLLEAGATVVIADYLKLGRLMEWLGGR